MLRATRDRSYVTLILSMLLLVTLPTARGAESGDGTMPVLIVTGVDYPGHHWQKTAPAHNPAQLGPLAGPSSL